MAAKKATSMKIIADARISRRRTGESNQVDELSPFSL
jgi:hypothetical protein